MKKIQQSESEILAILRKQEEGKKMSEIGREAVISEATFYNRKSC